MEDASLTQGLMPFDIAAERSKWRRSGAGLIDWISIVA